MTPVNSLTKTVRQLVIALVAWVAGCMVANASTPAPVTNAPTSATLAANSPTTRTQVSAATLSRPAPEPPTCAQHFRVVANGRTSTTLRGTKTGAPRAITLENNSGTDARIRVWSSSVPDVSSYDRIIELIRSQSGETSVGVAYAASRVVSRFRALNAFPADTGEECHDPVKLFNTYGYGLCDDSARVAAHLLNGFGFTTSIWDLTFHVVTEYGDGQTTAMLDADLDIVAMDPESSRPLSVREALWQPESLTSRSNLTSTPQEREAFRQQIVNLYTDRRTSATAAWVKTGTTHDASIMLRTGETMTRYSDARLGYYSQDKAGPVPPRYSNAVFEWRTKFPQTQADGITNYDTETRLPFVLVSGEIELRSEVMPTAYDGVEVTTDSKTWIALKPANSRMASNVLSERYVLPAELRGTYNVIIRLRPSEFCDQIDAPVHYYQRLVTQCSPTTFPDLDDNEADPQLYVDVEGEGAIDVTYSWDCEMPEKPAAFDWDWLPPHPTDELHTFDIPTASDPT